MIVVVKAIYAIAWRSVKKIQDFNGVEPVTSRLLVRCSTNWAMKPLTLEAGQLWVHMSPWKSRVQTPLKSRIFFFFQASLLNCINCVHCDDHFFISISFPPFIYDLFHISLTIRVLLVFRWRAVPSWQWTRWTGWIKRKTSFPPGNIKTLPSSASTYTLPWE